MEILCTTCCKEKSLDIEPVPAYQRYVSKRIQGIKILSDTSHTPFFILSGKFGLIHQDEKITSYDMLLTDGLVPHLANMVSEQIKKYAITSIIFYAQRREKSGLHTTKF